MQSPNTNEEEKNSSKKTQSLKLSGDIEVDAEEFFKFVQDIYICMKYIDTYMNTGALFDDCFEEARIFYFKKHELLKNQHE